MSGVYAAAAVAVGPSSSMRGPNNASPLPATSVSNFRCPPGHFITRPATPNVVATDTSAKLQDYAGLRAELSALADGTGWSPSVCPGRARGEVFQ